MVITRTPLRISFSGGGTDLPDYYKRDFGAVLSTTVDKYLYVTVKTHSPLFGEAIRLNYSESERVQQVDDLKHPIARETLRLFNIRSHLYISTVADLPGFSGLGSSSSFAVGLLNAIHQLLGLESSPKQLAEEAARIEIEILGRPIGKQDHYAAAFGGMNIFRFNKDGKTDVIPVQLGQAKQGELFDHLLFFHTGLSHDSGSVLSEQQAMIGDRLEILGTMRDQVFALQNLLKGGMNVEALGKLIDEGWRMKRRLASTVSNGHIDQWYEKGLVAGALGGKLLGAGGGGFLMFVVPPERQRSVRTALSELVEVPMGYSERGTEIIFSS